MKKAFAILLIVAALSVSYSGVREFDRANNWLQLLRGLFWMVVGVITFWRGIDLFKNDVEN